MWISPNQQRHFYTEDGGGRLVPINHMTWRHSAITEAMCDKLTHRRVLVPILAMEKKRELDMSTSLYFCIIYPVCKFHSFWAVFYRHLWPVRHNNIFSTLSIKRYDFEKKVFWPSLQICLKCFSFYDEFSETVPQMCTGLHVKYSLFLSDFNEA